MNNLEIDQLLIVGNYYQLSGKIRARRSLVISSLKPDKIIGFDLLVIMMNPGSSRAISDEPIEIIDQSIKSLSHLVQAHPDDTQSQIIRLMGLHNFQTALVINLSDVIETNSNTFVKELHECEYADAGSDHSIFNDIRTSELEEIKTLTRNCPVIIASGVNYKLRFLTRIAESSFDSSRVIGWKNSKGLFYHPLPRSKSKQEEWIQKIGSEISANKALHSDGNSAALHCRR